MAISDLISNIFLGMRLKSNMLTMYYPLAAKFPIHYFMSLVVPIMRFDGT